MNAEAKPVKRITAEKQWDAEGNLKGFRLCNGSEQITLEPGKAWAQVDHYKWVTRGLLEEPSGYHVLANGAVQIHGEQIEPEEADGVARLEERINQHFVGVPLKVSRPAKAAESEEKVSGGNGKVKFKVRLDKLGHLMVMGLHGGERVETGVRGLDGFVRNGLMLKPRSIHIDPLLRYVEIDDARFDSNAAGAEALENLLNSSYAPVLKDDGHAAIEIRANPASASGFDIHFMTVRAGARFEVKGHLAQEQLDILQDTVRCQLMRSGIVLKIAPPHLIIRRRRHDGSEEKIPELPDVQYLRVTAGELQRILNHPLIRRNGVATETGATPGVEGKPAEIEEKTIAPVEPVEAPKAVIEELKRVIETAAAVRESGREFGQRATSEVATLMEEQAPEEVQAVFEPAQETVSEIHRLFEGLDPARINIEIFRRLELCLGTPVQDVRLSMEMIFQDRQFEIISFTHQEVSSVLEIRSEDFIGFYLTHINEQRILLDYAYKGKRIEWGPKKCFLQASVTADPEEFSGNGLLGMALVEKNQFVFVVTPVFKQWMKARERMFHEAGASFITVDELAAEPGKYPLVWPVP